MTVAVARAVGVLVALMVEGVVGGQRAHIHPQNHDSRIPLHHRPLEMKHSPPLCEVKHPHPSHGCDLGNDGEEGVTAEINKCAKCDSNNGKLP